MTYNNVYFDQGERKPKTILIDSPHPPPPPPTAPHIDEA